MTDARDTAADGGSLAAQQNDRRRDEAPHLSMQGIVKRYGAVSALDRVDLDVRSGEIHALLGENGAGKSTLMHILSGSTQPDAGQIVLSGEIVRIGSPRIARAQGIAMVHQHFALVPACTVEENLALDASPQRSFRPFSHASAAAPALERAAALGWSLKPTELISNLGVGAQQRIEIVKALATNARLLIFDEPTAVLSPDEVDELFGVLHRLRDEGCAVILIAHKLAEIMEVSDRVTVLRRGVRVASCRTSDTNLRQLAEWMIGAETVHVSVPAAPAAPGGALPAKAPSLQKSDRIAASSETEPTSVAEIRFEARSLEIVGDRGERAIRGVSLDVAAGEIFGIGGVDGNGQTELAEALVGLRHMVSGEIYWMNGPFVPGTTPRLGFIPQDRRRAGLALTMSIEENLLWDAVREPRFRKSFVLCRNELHKLALQLREQFDIRTPSIALPASSLSGGNQQKIVVARALHAEPEWIVAVNPTRGLDIGATRFVHSQLRAARDRGAAIVLISTDLDEIAALADRAGILSGGILTEYDVSQIDTTQIGLLLGGVRTQTTAAGVRI
jgi:simple sugar transport system ATP-binding protein